MNIDEIREIAAIASEFGLESIELEGEGGSLKIKRAVSAAQTASSLVPTPAPAATPALEAKPDGAMVLSPIVGVYYGAPAPGAEPFVRAGSRVARGDTLCIVEAMKMMNEISAEQDGEIAELIAFDGQVVEYGQPLMRIV